MVRTSIKALNSILFVIFFAKLSHIAPGVGLLYQIPHHFLIFCKLASSKIFFVILNVFYRKKTWQYLRLKKCKIGPQIGNAWINVFDLDPDNLNLTFSNFAVVSSISSWTRSARVKNRSLKYLIVAEIFGCHMISSYQTSVFFLGEKEIRKIVTYSRTP